MKKLILLLNLLISYSIFSQEISINLSNFTYLTDFNSLANTSTSTVLPNGWYINETGTLANSTYTAGTGTNNTGDSYSYGLSGSSERSLGGLRSNSLNPIRGCKVKNNTGEVLESISISYVGETWRVGNSWRPDRIDFQYSTDATSLTTGTWTDVNELDYQNPGQVAISGLLAHSANISFTINSIYLNNNSTIWFRFTDFDAIGADDGMAIDDFSINASIAVSLPVELVSFYSSSDEESNIIWWQTATERNSDYFILERSTNGFNWTEISRLQAAGNSNTLIDYQFIDKTFTEQISYYRLIQYDFDGLSETFGPISGFNSSKKFDSQVINIYNLNGQEVDDDYKGFIYILYDNGQTKRKLN
jgi:hypothetical protein